MFASVGSKRKAKMKVFFFLGAKMKLMGSKWKARIKLSMNHDILLNKKKKLEGMIL